jgi:hypothetical protein
LLDRRNQSAVHPTRFNLVGHHAGVDALRDYGRMVWAFGLSDEPQRITGLDVAVVNAGRISALYTFLDPAGA